MELRPITGWLGYYERKIGEVTGTSQSYVWSIINKRIRAEV